MLGITITVGQRESEDVSERDSDVKMATSSAVVEDMAKDGQEELPEIIEQIPSSESNLEELTQPAESQSSDVGFKKVFKFVGFKFTVKKDKTEKSDTVQLLTVKKDEGEGAGEPNGAGDHQDPGCEAAEATPKESELKQSTEQAEETPKLEQNNAEASPQAESEQAEEESKDEEEKQEPTKSPESPTSPLASETASPFKKLFTQGWAGWRKKTSFRKPKEEELKASEKKKEREPEKADSEENEKPEATCEKQGAPEPPHPQATEGESGARLSAEYEKVELPTEYQVQGGSEEKTAPLATEVFDEKVEIVAEVHVNTVEGKMEEQEKEGAGEAAESLPTEKEADASTQAEAAESHEELVKPQEVGAVAGDPLQPPELGPEEKVLSVHPEGIVSEVEILSSQERIKVQGSPLKKLFTSSGLKKLSGKKLKGKRGAGGGDEESGELQPGAAESPDSTDEQKGDSSASSPEEPEEPACVEKGLGEAPPEADLEEGVTSDGEKKREGITPWASFKKMVTPKKRVRRPSESDKEDELDKVKSATLSSTESATSEMQDEGRGSGEEQRPEEPRRKVDTSVSWEALICVGSSKKRARKGSSSDEEGPPKTTGGDGQKADEGGKDREAGADPGPASAQEHDQAAAGSSPEPAGSPSEGEGVSTWESFKRLVTARKKSKSKLEEKNEESVTGSGAEHPASEAEPGREESWVSIKKLIPGRRKKRPDGKQEQATAGDPGPAEANEDDPDVPAVVPLSEYDAVEREKMEAQQAQKSEGRPEPQAAAEVDDLARTAPPAVVDGARSLTDVEERSPSWISASVAGPLEQGGGEVTVPTGEAAVQQARVAATPEGRDASDDTLVSEVASELTSEAVTAAETTGAFCAEEAAEVSGAEETTDMVSAVSQLTESPDTTEEATPVQEAEGGGPDQEDLARRTREVLQAVAEKVGEEAGLPDGRALAGRVRAAHKAEPEIAEEAEEAEEEAGAPDLKKEVEEVSKVQVQETKELTQGEVTVHAAPESSGIIPQDTESVTSSELTAPHEAETSVGVKSEQTVAPDSAETLTDSESPGSTPVADCESTQHKIGHEVGDDGVASSGQQPRVPETQTGTPPAPSGSPPGEEDMEHSEEKVVLEHTAAVASGEMAPVLSKTEASQEVGEEPRDGPPVEGLEVSTDAEVTFVQERRPEVTPGDHVPKDTESGKDEAELHSQTEAAPAPADRGMAGQVEKEKTEAKSTQGSEEKPECDPSATSEEPREIPDQTVKVSSTEGPVGEASSLEEGSPPSQEGLICTEIQAQSSEASQTLTADVVGEKKVLRKTVKILETTEILGSAEAHLVLEEKSTKDDEAQPGAEASPPGTESGAESAPVTVSAATGEGLSADLEGAPATAQTRESEQGHEPGVCREVLGSIRWEEDTKAEKEILQLESESSRLVENVIQTVVEQLVSTEETATESQTQAPPVKAEQPAENQPPEQRVEKEERELPALTKSGTETLSSREESAPDPSEQACSGSAREVSEAVAVESPRVDAQQLEEVPLPSGDERGEPGSKSVPEGDGGAELGDRIEKAPCDSPGEGKGDVVHRPEEQMSALEAVEPSGGLKEPLDTNGPKLKEQEDSQEVCRASEDIRTQTQETQKEEREPAKSEVAES
ncbi:PREDICTED: A-kinase anchor protein 12 isoform X2 [Condylura cristata]|uniref:A-kinase anchor protein 12 isoform X2 n=1 Tax=Condylura cristata TaxID=143302 RepID=UPI000642FC47|nr:PREDICTED: A-kinase anchor protein 12 isoform X2 [Condylura cristata]